MLLQKNNSNTTLVKVKYTCLSNIRKIVYHSNTTLVKVKSFCVNVIGASIPYSNTTLVKVKFIPQFIQDGQDNSFKYNSC